MSYETQDFSIRKMVLGAKKQTTYGTALLDASLTQTQRVDGGAFLAITKKFRDDMDRAGKGHPWSTEHQEVERESAFQFAGELNAFLAGWLGAFSLLKDTVTGPGPYIHTFTPELSTNIAPVTSIYFEDTADLKRKLADLAITQLELSGGANGALAFNATLAGSGKLTAGAMVSGPPALPTDTYLLASDSDILIGAPAAAASIKERIRSWNVKIASGIALHRAPGGGIYPTFTKIGFPRFSLSLVIAAKDADDIQSLHLNDTVQEVQINTNSGAAAQLNIKFPHLYLSAAKLGLDGAEEVWSVESDERSVVVSGAANPIELVATNSVATYLTAG